MTVSRSLLPAMPRSWALETALSAMARTLGDRPSAPWARTAGTAVVLAGLAKAAEAARLSRRAKQKTEARFLKLISPEEGEQVGFTRSRPPGCLSRALPARDALGMDTVKPAHSQ